MVNKEKKFLVIEVILRRYHKIFILFLIATFVAIAFLVSMDEPEWFSGAHNWFEFGYNISLSIIAGFIFFCFQVIIPNYKKDYIRKILLTYKQKEFFEYLDSFYRAVTIYSGHYENYDFNSTDFLERHPEGYTDLFSFESIEGDDKIVNALLDMKSQSLSNGKGEILAASKDYINEITTKFEDLLDGDIVMKLIEFSNETYIIESGVDLLLGDETSENIRNEVLKSIKKLYFKLREVQFDLRISPAYSTTKFSPIEF